MGSNSMNIMISLATKKYDNLAFGKIYAQNYVTLTLNSYIS